MKNITAEAPEIDNGRLPRQKSNQSYSDREPDAGGWRDTNTTDPGHRQFDDIDSQQIAEAAYLRWESGGRPADTAEDDWFWAERELTRQRESARRIPRRAEHKKGEAPRRLKLRGIEDLL